MTANNSFLRIEPSNTPTASDFDLLEDELEDRKVPIEKLLLVYRDFLLKTLAKREFGNVASTDLKRLSCYLEKSAELLMLRKEEERSRIRSELWGIADENQKNNPDLYNLARCVIFFYGKISDWEQAQDPPIFYFLVFLRGVIPDIEPEFVAYFRQALSLG